MKRSIKAIILASTTLVSMHHGTSFADNAALPQVTMIETSGDGCLTPDKVVGTLTELGESSHGRKDLAYDMVFTDMSTGTLPPNQPGAFIDCTIALEVTPPAGYAFAINKILMQGAYDAQRVETYAEVAGNYSYYTHYRDQSGNLHGEETSFQGHNMNFEIQLNEPLDEQRLEAYRVLTADGLGMDAGNFSLELADRNVMDAPCGKTVYVTGNIALAASSYGTIPADVSMQRVVATQRARLGWGWQLVKCGHTPPPTHTPGCRSTIGHEWSGNWMSSYLVQGSEVEARLTIQPDGSGFYRTPTFTGRLKNMKQCDDRLIGEWATGNQSGKIDFSLTSESSFSGTYSNPRAGNGEWNGHR